MVNLTFGEPNGLTQGFNWVFLLELIVVVIVALFLLFFFNRVFGFVVSYIIRTVTWHRSKAYIHVESIQISFLAGRILFKNFRYQSRNQSIYILKGHITWRYWLRRVRVKENSRVKEGVNSKLPCRIVLVLEGVEWFIYNRTPAYDAVLAAAEGRNNPTPPQNGDGLGRTTTNRTSAERPSDDSLKQQESESSPINVDLEAQSSETTSLFLHVLPIQVLCRKGAIILGNTALPTIVVAQFASADLSIDAAESRSKFDLYKMVYDVTFVRPTIQFKMNIDYKENLLARASNVVEKAEAVPTRTMPSMWRTVRDMIPLFQESSESLARQPTPPRPTSSSKEEKPWTGLPRYSTNLDEDATEAADNDPLLQPTDVTEYAKLTTILDAAELQLTFYYDEPGLVPPLAQQLHCDEEHIGNGDLSPEWGMNIEVTGATISYGPWADRQRGILQEMFFPGVYEDTYVGPRLNPGDRRVYAYFKVLVEFKNAVTLKIPTKEKSKDWKYSAQYLRSSIDQRVTTRPFGWIEMKAGAESTITYHMGLTPRHDGWTNFMNLELRKLQVTTSVNYGLLSEADGVRVQCDLSNPLKWNELHKWAFNFTIFKPSIFLLRDHITLLTDCGADWTNETGDYATWIPYIYTLNFNLVDFSLFLNVNDGNIISSPSELNENSYVAFRGAKFSAKAIVPSDKISPIEHNVDFELACPSLTMTIHAPLWNTLSILLSQREVGQFHKLEVTGSYTYPSDVSRNNIETLDMQVSASYCSVVFYGFVLRYFFNVRNNYFGDHTQFVTLEEYQKDARMSAPASIHSTGKKPPVSNVLDVILAIEVNKGALIMPSRLYEMSEGIRMHFDMLQADVRFMDYYMDLQINVTPVSCYHHVKERMEEIFEELGDKVPEAFIDGITVHAHRLLGKPPSNPAYICNWDFDVGMISGDSKMPFLLAVNSAMDSFVYNLVDVENALPDITPPDRDITFLRLNAAGAAFRIPIENNEIRVQLGPTTVGLDDRTSLLRSGRITINIGSLATQILRDNQKVASFNTAIRTTILSRRQDLLDHGPKQSQHVREHDAPTRRAWFLYSKRRGHAQEDLDTFEIDLPPLSQSRVNNLHVRNFKPRHMPLEHKDPMRDVNFASAFMSPQYTSFDLKGESPRCPITPVFNEATPMLHSSYSDIVSTHVDNLPPAQKTFIVEVSADTTLLLSADFLSSAEAIYQALDSTDYVASLDDFQRSTVLEILTAKHDRSTVTFAEIIVPRLKVVLQGEGGSGLSIDILDLVPQLRSVHYKDGREKNANVVFESNMSVITSLRSTDISMFHHKGSILDLNEIPNVGRADIVNVSLQNLAIKGRQGSLLFGSCSIDNIEGLVDVHEMDALVNYSNQWITRVSDLISFVDTFDQQRLYRSRNLVAAFVLAGDKYGVTSDPPFLTRPSHVLRISQNPLRIDDSWKISARVRHIARSLAPEVLSDIQRHFEKTSSCTINAKEDVMEILSRWRSWELSNIEKTFFFKWLSGAPPANPNPPVGSESILYLKRLRARLDLKDGNENDLNMSEATIVIKGKTSDDPVIAADSLCDGLSIRIGTDLVDVIRLAQQLSKNMQKVTTPDTSPPTSSTSPDVSAIATRYHGTALLKEFNIYAKLADTPLSFTIKETRVSGSKQLLHMQTKVPSACLSFEQAMFEVLESSRSPVAAAQLCLANFSSQIILSEKAPGIAANLALFAVRLSKPVPWLIARLNEIYAQVGELFERSTPGKTYPDLDARVMRLKKPDLPTITFRLYRVSLEGWLVPEALMMNLDGGGVQVALGDLTDRQQWCFIDIPPATLSLYRLSGDEQVKFAEISTPFSAVIAGIMWAAGICRISADVQIGTLSLSLTNLMCLFQSIASEEVISHLKECQEALEKSVFGKADAPVTPIQSDSTSILSYRVNSLLESIEITAETPHGEFVFAYSDVRASVSNRMVRTQNHRVLFTARSQSTSLSLLSSKHPDQRVKIVDVHWELGNSLNPDKGGNTLYRMYLISNMFTVTLSPQIIEKAALAMRHIMNEVENLKIHETLKNLSVSKNEKSQEHPTASQDEGEVDPLEAFSYIEGLHVSLSQLKLKWIANDDFKDSHGFSFKVKTIDASVVDRITRGRFVVQNAEFDLDCHDVPISSNYARLPKLDLNLYRQIEDDGWQLQLDAHGDVFQVNCTPLCIEVGHTVLESVTAAAAHLREHFPPDPSMADSNVLTSAAILHQTKKLKAVVTSIDFSGAKINAQYDKGFKPTDYMSRYRVLGDGCDVGFLQIPGLSLRSRFSRQPRHVFHAEICILESTNILSPSIKPFIHDILHRIEHVMSRRKRFPPDEPSSRPRSSDSNAPNTAAILGDLKFSVGLRIQSQELTLTCDPFAKVDARVGLNEVYATLISCKTPNHDQTFAVMVSLSGTHASLQHHYSGFASARIGLNDLNLSLFNNDQIKTAEPGVAALIKSSGLDITLNARQGQDFLIFNSLWLEGPPPDPIAEMRLKRMSNPISMQQQIQKVTLLPPSFPLNITVHLEKIKFSVDLGQSIGTTDLEIRGMRISNRKCSEYHHCVFLNMDSAQAESKGRFSGYMKTEKFMVQTSIYFPTIALAATPLVQIDVNLGYLEFRASFEYHVFLIGDSKGLRFTIYNRRIRQSDETSTDRLVLLGNSELIQLYATAEGPALVLSLYKSIIQLQEEKEQSRTLELASFLDQSLSPRSPRQRPSEELSLWYDNSSTSRVDMEMSIKFSKINTGIFKAALNDSPVFRVNIADIRALFSQSISGGALTNQLNLSLGQLGIALSPLKRMSGKELAEMEVEKWIKHVSTMRGGIILGVPETEGSMWTKQERDSDVVQHVFKSQLAGKVDIGWNYGSVMYVQELWKTFQLKLEQGAEARVTPLTRKEEEGIADQVQEQIAKREKEDEQPVSAEVSTSTIGTRTYTYIALEPAIVETPQLRQMGEATPPMEWIGVNRMKLPAFTHQAIIVPLQKVSRRVENLYNLTLQGQGS